MSSFWWQVEFLKLAVYQPQPSTDRQRVPTLLFNISNLNKFNMRTVPQSSDNVIIEWIAIC